MWMNEYDVEDAVRRFGEQTPNLQRGAWILYNLVQWTNNNSDGWPYWQKPSKAAAKLMEALESRRRYDAEDLTAAELSAALRPIKSFLTREGVNHAEILS